MLVLELAKLARRDLRSGKALLNLLYLRFGGIWLGELGEAVSNAPSGELFGPTHQIVVLNRSNDTIVRLDENTNHVFVLHELPAEVSTVLAIA